MERSASCKVYNRSENVRLNRTQWLITTLTTALHWSEPDESSSQPHVFFIKISFNIILPCRPKFCILFSGRPCLLHADTSQFP